MDNLLFLNHGSTDTRVKLVSLDGNPIVTNSAGAIFGEGNELGFCLRADTELLEMLKPDDSGVIRLQGSFTFEFEGEDIYGNYTGTRPTHIVDASNFGKLIEAEYSDYLQVEIPPDAPQPDPENDVPFSYILKTKYRKCWLRIYSLSVDSNLSADAIGNGSAAWMDEDVQNGAIFHFGDSVTPSPTPLTYTANGNTSLVVSPYPGESVKVMVDWGYGWFNSYEVTTPLTQIDWTASTSLKNVRIFFDRPIEGLGISNVVALTEWGSAEISSVRFNHFWHNTSYTGRLVPDHIPTYLTDLSGMFQDTFSEDSFNEDISMWDVSNVTDMSYMFRGAQYFNQDLSGWCVSNILSEPEAFATGSGLVDENKPVWGTCPYKGVRLISFENNARDIRLGADGGTGDTIKTYVVNEQNVVVRELDGIGIFKLPAGKHTLYCKESELPAGVTFDKISVIAQYEGLVKVTAWSKPFIAYCAISSDSYPSEFLTNVPSTRPNISSRDYSGLFSGAVSFNDPNVIGWDVSWVTNFKSAFRNCRDFNQDISGWNVGNGTNFESMFENTKNFQAPIGKWNMANATKLRLMFAYSNFNQPIGDWDVSKVTDMFNFISEAANFAQDLTSWCVTNITTEPNNWTWRNLMTPELSPVWGTCPFRGIELIEFEVDASKGYTRLGAYSNGIEQDVYIVNSATGVVAKEPRGITTVDIPTGKYGMYVKAEELKVPLENLTVELSNPSLIRVTKWSAQPIKECIISPSAYPATNLVGVPNTAPNSLQTNFSNMFNGASEFNDPNVVNWDVSRATTMEKMFRYCTKFNQDISGWDVSNVTTFAEMFRGCTLFNQPIGSWNVGKGTTFAYMFKDCKAFNQSLSTWDVSSAITLTSMFESAVNFVANIGSWKVGKVTNMDNLLWQVEGIDSVIGDLSGWCVTNITSRPSGFRSVQSAEVDRLSPQWGTCPNSTKPPTDPTGMTTPYTFKTASTAFNASSSDPFAVTVQGVRHDAVLVDTTYTLTDIASAVGDIITVEPADYAVGYTSVITLTAQPSEIINWSDFHWGDKVVGVQPSLRALLKVPTTAPLTRNFEGLLKNAVLYLGADVTNWDTSEVTNFKQLFQGCNKFVGEIGGWDTSKVTSFANLFTYCHEFNGDITGWDTSSVTTLEMMLLDTRKFNQPIGSWNVSKVTNMNNMIYNGWAMAADLSQWCVSLIPTEPTGFILSANQLAGKPVWGTCPNGS